MQNLTDIRKEYYNIKDLQGEEQAEIWLDENDYSYKERCEIKINNNIKVIKSESNTKNNNIEAKMIKLQGLRTLPEKKHIIRRLGLSRGNLGLLVAVGGSGKTMLSQYISTCVSTGLPLFGKFETQKGRCIHIDQEQSEIQTQRRYERIAGALNITNLDIIRWTLKERLDANNSNLDDVEDELVAAAKGSIFIIIDSLKKCSVADENSDRIEPVLKMLKNVAERTQCAILMIHHKGKSKSDARQTGRGHSSIYDSVDVQIDLDINNDHTFELSCLKNRDGKSFAGIKYILSDDGEWVDEQDCTEFLNFNLVEDEIVKHNDARLSILQLLSDYKTPLTQSFLYDSIKGDRKSFKLELDKMVNNNEIICNKGPKNSNLYEITADGCAIIENYK